MTDAELGKRMAVYLENREAEAAAETGEWATMTPYDEAALAQAAPITERLAGLVQDGRNIVGPDGKVEVFDGVPTLDSTLAEALEMWERAREQEQDAAAYVERRQAAALDALMEHPEFEAQAARRAHYEAKRKGIEAAIAAALTRTDPDATLSVDTGRVRLTWPKRTTRWTLAQEIEWYASAAAIAQLSGALRRAAERFGLVGVEAEPLADRLAYAVLDWLAPVAKRSEPAGPRYTVRDGAK